MEDLDADKVVDADNVAETDLVPVRLVVVDLVVVTLRLRLRVLTGRPSRSTWQIPSTGFATLWILLHVSGQAALLQPVVDYANVPSVHDVQQVELRLIRQVEL